MTPPSDDRSQLICYNLPREIACETIYFRAKCPAAYVLSASLFQVLSIVEEHIRHWNIHQIWDKILSTARIIVTSPVITDDQQYFDESFLTILNKNSIDNKISSSMFQTI